MISRSEKIRFVILRTIGNFLVLVSLYGMFATFGPVAAEEVRYRYRQARGITYVVAHETAQTNGKQPEVTPSPRPSLFEEIVKKNTTEYLTPVDTNFGIIIPKIGANSRVIPNVDAADRDAYMEALKQGVAHAAGTGLPGVEVPNRSIYLFAHSTDSFLNAARYNAVFYLLKELVAGDEIDIYFGGKRFIYLVEDKKTVKPDDVSFIIQPTSEEQLILQTCWPPGTTFERFMVIAKPKKVEEAPAPTEVPVPTETPQPATGSGEEKKINEQPNKMHFGELSRG